MASIYCTLSLGLALFQELFFILIGSFHPHSSLKRQGLLFYPFYRWANWGPAMLFNELFWGLTAGRKSDSRALILCHHTRMNCGHAGDAVSCSVKRPWQQENLDLVLVSTLMQPASYVCLWARHETFLSLSLLIREMGIIIFYSHTEGGKKCDKDWEQYLS